jgi:hypothetical protein
LAGLRGGGGAVAVGTALVGVGGTAVAVGGTAVAVGGTCVAVGRGARVGVAGTWVGRAVAGWVTVGKAAADWPGTLVEPATAAVGVVAVAVGVVAAAVRSIVVAGAARFTSFEVGTTGKATSEVGVGLWLPEIASSPTRPRPTRSNNPYSQKIIKQGRRAVFLSGVSCTAVAAS